MKKLLFTLFFCLVLTIGLFCIKPIIVHAGNTFQSGNEYHVLSKHYPIHPGQHKIIRIYFPYFAKNLSRHNVDVLASAANEKKTDWKGFPNHSTKVHGVDCGAPIYSRDEKGKYIEWNFCNNSGGLRYVSMGFHIPVSLIPVDQRLEQDDVIKTVEQYFTAK